MTEEISKIISNSITTYTKNLNLCIPFILNIVMIALTAIIITIFSLVYLFGSSSVNEYSDNNSSDRDQDNIQNKWNTQIRILCVSVNTVTYDLTYFFRHFQPS